MSASWQRILGLMITSSWLFVGCSGVKKIEVGGTCILNSDCSQGLVCTWGICHVACRTSADCQPGQSCIAASDQSMVCQGPTFCTYNSNCPTGLICAVDRQCRQQCQKDVDCTSGQICTSTQTCAELNQVDSSKNLIGTDGGVSDAAGDVIEVSGPADTTAASQPTADDGSTDVGSIIADVSAADQSTIDGNSISAVVYPATGYFGPNFLDPSVTTSVYGQEGSFRADVPPNTSLKVVLTRQSGTPYWGWVLGTDSCWTVTTYDFVNNQQEFAVLGSAYAQSCDLEFGFGNCLFCPPANGGGGGWCFQVDYYENFELAGETPTRSRVICGEESVGMADAGLSSTGG